MEVRLYVGNLPNTTTEDDLRTLFAQAGEVALVMLIKDQDSGNSKGFAFVEMSNQGEADQAISMLNSFNLANRQLTVRLANRRSGSSRQRGRQRR